MDRDAEPFQVLAKRSVERADHRRGDGSLVDQRAQQVHQVELGAAQVELVGADQHRPPAASTWMWRTRRRRRQILVTVAFLATRRNLDRDRWQLVLLAMRTRRHGAQHRLARVEVELAEVGRHVEAADAREGVAGSALDVRPRQPDPCPAKRVLAEPQVELRRRSGREQRPAADIERAAVRFATARRFVDPAVRAARKRSGKQHRHVRRDAEAPHPARRPQAPEERCPEVTGTPHTRSAAAALSQLCVSSIPTSSEVGSKPVSSRSRLVSR